MKAQKVQDELQTNTFATKKVAFETNSPHATLPLAN